MAPSHKRKALEDDFIHTISDNDEDIVPAEEEELAEDVDATGDEDTGTDAILAPQTLLLELGAPRPFFK